MTQRIRILNSFALAIVIMYIGAASVFLQDRTIVDPWFDRAIVFLTSVGFYQILTDVIYFLVSEVRFLLLLYWRNDFIDGIWSYSYTIEGDPTRSVYFGVWRFEQNLFETKVVGFGLSDEFAVRSRVRSVTDILRSGADCEFINLRSDSADPHGDYYSRTLMYFESVDKFLLKYPICMRGKTLIYGGPRNGLVANNYFMRHPAAKTEQDVIDELKRSFLAHGAVHPKAKLVGAPP